MLDVLLSALDWPLTDAALPLSELPVDLVAQQVFAERMSRQTKLSPIAAAQRYLVPLIPFVFTVPAAVVANIVMTSWHTDSHDVCGAVQPFWSTAYLWVPGLSLLGLVAAVFCSFAPGTPRLLRIAGPVSAVTVLAWSCWPFLHAFRLEWCI